VRNVEGRRGRRGGCTRIVLRRAAAVSAGRDCRNTGNIANRKGFWLVLQCQIVAPFTVMQTTDESPTGAAPARAPSSPASHPAVAVDTHETSSAPAATRDAAGAGDAGAAAREPSERRPREIGGRDGPEPTRFGDWEKAGRCIDF
jgi:hypothetical protein